jgi:hypothetical protein
MFLDKLDQLSLAQALTATAISANVVDLGVAGSGLPDGIPLEAVIVVKAAADFTTTDETYNFDVVTSSAVNLATTPVSLGKRAILATALTLGSKHHIPLAPGVTMARYLGMQYTLAGTTPSVTVDCYIQPMNMADDVPKAYPIGSVIL